MQHGIPKIDLVLVTYKRPIFPSSVAVLVAVLFGIGAIGLIVYQLGSFVIDKISPSQVLVDRSGTQGADPKLGVIGGVVMNMDSIWVQNNLAAAQTAHIKAGLHCFDALGGPSPQNMIAHVKTQLGDARMQSMLDKLGASIHKTGPQVGGASSCATWILSG